MVGEGGIQAFWWGGVVVEHWVIRGAELKDHADIFKIAKVSPYTKDFGNQVMFSSVMAYAKGWIRVIVVSGIIVGFTCIRVKIRKPRTKLYFLGVAPNHRRQGIGKMLVHDLWKTIPITHASIELSCALANEAAKQLYLALGFTVEAVDERYFYMVGAAPV